MHWARGARFPSEYSYSHDAATGALVHRVTSRATINHATYFLQSSFYPDSSGLIFVSYRSGAAQLYDISPFPGGDIRQLTDGEPIHPFSPAIHPDGGCIYLVRRGCLYCLERQNLSERCVVRFDGAQLGECSISSGAEWLAAAAARDGNKGIVCGRADGREWQFLPFPRTVIHPQFHPFDKDWIEFAGDPAPRMHRIRRDGAGLECLYEHGNDEFLVHETFLGTTGDIVYTVWPHALKRMSWLTGKHSIICNFNAWHITPNRAGSKILCDTNHPDRGLFLIDVASGSRRLICRPESSNQGSQWKTSRYALAGDFAAARAAAESGALSWMETATDTVYGPQWTHPHPSFSPDESKVVFVSDRSGHPQVYVAEIPGGAS